MSTVKTPIFKYLTKNQGEKLAKIFNIIRCEDGQVLLIYGKWVPGIYIVVKGAVDVYTEGFGVHLARMKFGDTIGEMALIESLTASASVCAVGDDTELLFCRANDFQELLDSDPELAANFYRGAAVILSNRLRATNNRVQKELENIKLVITNLMRNESVVQRRNKMKSAISNSGSYVVNQLALVLPIIEQLIEDIPERAVPLRHIKDIIENALKRGTQNFDRVWKRISDIQNSLIGIHGDLHGDLISQQQRNASERDTLDQ